jgi:hypothetical protein
VPNVSGGSNAHCTSAESDICRARCVRAAVSLKGRLLSTRSATSDANCSAIASISGWEVSAQNSITPSRSMPSSSGAQMCRPPCPSGTARSWEDQYARPAVVPSTPSAGPASAPSRTSGTSRCCWTSTR